MVSTVAMSLPDEILSIICEELAQEREYDTLYNCSLCSRNLADPALRFLYQYHELSPAFIQSDEENIRHYGASFQQKLKQAERSFKKWTFLWRSIVASSLANTTTYKPYCRYLRILDFRNLAQMLDDPKFTNTIRRDFFKKGLDSFHFPMQMGKRSTIDIIATVNAVGEAVVPKTFQLEEISGDLTLGFLARWVVNTPRLKNIVLFKGDALGQGAGQAISQYCEHFQSLTIREWNAPSADETFANFLEELKEDTLQYFEMISFNALHRQSFQALGRHRDLQELKLANLSEEGVRSLDALKSCINLHTLVIEDTLGTTQLESLNNDVFMDVVQWLSSCESLRDLTIKKLFDGPAILAQVVSSPKVRLKRLSVEGYVLHRQNSAAFHTALAEQNELESLLLKGNGEDASPDDLSIMVEALSNLHSLRELLLRDISDEFEEDHIIALALELNKLEEFWTSGLEISENTLMLFANMKNLKVLTLLVQTQFTSVSILDFVDKLDPDKQKGFVLSLMAQHTDFALSDEEQEMIRAVIEKHVNGQFEYAIWRDPESDDDFSD